MARPVREVLLGIPYHITQRGNYRQTVFSRDADYLYYLELLWHYGQKYGLAVWAYCLMPNHLHLVAVPEHALAFARTFGIGHMQYARYRNRCAQQVGHLWQGRFFAAPLDEVHCGRAVRYVEMNPVRAGLVAGPEEWPWSSAGIHLRGESLPGVTYPSPEALASWREFLGQEDTPSSIAQLRAGTYAGRPLGDAAFLQQLEQRFGKSFTRNPRGRPKKTTKFTSDPNYP